MVPPGVQWDNAPLCSHRGPVAKTPGAQRKARGTVVLELVAVTRALYPELPSELADVAQEIGDIVLAVWNADWPEAFRVVSAGDTLGSLLLCNADDGSCVRNENVRLVLSVGADIAIAKSGDEVQSALHRVVERAQSSEFAEVVWKPVGDSALSRVDGLSDVVRLISRGCIAN